MARLIVLLLLLAPGVALADPVSLIAAAVVNIGGFTGLAALAIQAGGMLLSSAMARRKQRKAAAKQRAEYNAGLQDRNVMVLSAEAPWQIVYGSPAPVGGALQAVLTSGDRDEFKHLVVVFAAHECEAIDEIYIDGDPVGPLDINGGCMGGAFYEIQGDNTVTEAVTLDGSGVGTVAHTIQALLSVTMEIPGDERSTSATVPATFSGTTVTAPAAAGETVQVSYSYQVPLPRVFVSKHLSPGGVDTADARLMAAVPGYWGPMHKLSGFTYAVVTLDLRFARFQGGPPNISAKLRAKKLYDPRTGLTTYSANNALCEADYLRGEYGYSASAGQIDTAPLIAAANACDAQGFECHGTLSTANDRDSNLQQIEDSYAAASHFSGGVWRIMAGAWSTPVMALTDAHLAGRIEVVQASEPADRRYNGARGQYVPAIGLGVAADITPYSVPAYLADDGLPRILDVPFPLTGTHQQCLKLAGIAVERSRRGMVINYPAHFPAWRLQPGDRVTVTNAELGFVSKPFRVSDWTYVSTAPIGLVLAEDDSSAWTGVYTAEDPRPATSNLADPFARPEKPAGLDAMSGDAQMLKAADGTLTPRVLVVWEPSTVRAVLQGGHTQLQWRPATADAAWQSMDLPPDASSQYLPNVQDGMQILVQVRHVTGVNAEGAWATIPHQVLGKSAPPPNVLTFTIDGDRLSWSPVQALDLAGYEIRYQYGNSTWFPTATRLHEGLLLASPFTMPVKLQGVVTIMIVAQDTSGNISTVPATIVADFGPAQDQNIIVTWPQAPLWDQGTITGGTVIGGELVADAVDRMYEPPGEPMYEPASAPFYPPAAYGEMTYEWTVIANEVGTLKLGNDISSIGHSIEYFRGDQSAMYAPAGEPMYAPAGDPMYGDPGEWMPWPGSIEMTGSEVIRFRIKTIGGTYQSKITAATPYIDVPSIEENLSDVVIAPGGTRLPIALDYRHITNILATVQSDGNGGVNVRVLEKDEPFLGPLVVVLNSSGTAVAGLLDARIKGY